MNTYSLAPHKLPERGNMNLYCLGAGKICAFGTVQNRTTRQNGYFNSIFFSVELMADPGKEDFEYSVKVTIGFIDIVSLTELILPCQLKLE